MSVTPRKAVSASQNLRRPRIVLAVDVGALRAGASAVQLGPWSPSAPELEPLAAAGGGALGLAWIAQRELDAPGARAPLTVAVGDCVKRGAPTAARASIASRAPLSGLFAEGLVGGDLARRLATLADLLALSSSGPLARGASDVLVIESDGSARLEHSPELACASAAHAHAELRRRWGECDMLAVGPAGEQGLPIANLAASGSTPHFVGRGGLGAVLGDLGLKAVCVRAPLIESRADARLTRALLASPRLEERARGGTFEQLHALAAAGDLGQRSTASAPKRELVESLEGELERSRSAAHGCHGCPTPCGWVFRTERGADQGARFGASHALGLNLGLEHFDDALALLALCDEFGVDAKEAGAGLALLARASELRLERAAPAFGDRSGFERLLRACARPRVEVQDELELAFRRGPRALAARLNLASEHAAAKGASARPDANLAARLGQCVSSRGGDSMRTFTFAAADVAQIRAWSSGGGFELPDAAFDPRSPEGKGLLVAWHEDWSNALDAVGFCSFSAAALLSDRVMTLVDLERTLAPELVADEGPGALLRLGAQITLAQRALNLRYGVRGDDERPEWARAELDQPGMLPLYLEVRALQERRAWRYDVAPVELQAPIERPAAVQSRVLGRVSLRCSGVLAQRLGKQFEVELLLPCGVAELLERVAQLYPEAAPALVASGQPIASVFRVGRGLRADDEVTRGDELDLVAVVSGG